MLAKPNNVCFLGFPSDSCDCMRLRVLSHSIISSPLNIPEAESYYVQLQVISQSLGALYPDQNCLLQLRAEAHCQPVCPCARPVIGWPGICDEGSASPEDVSCPSCKTHKEHGRRGLPLSCDIIRNTLEAGKKDVRCRICSVPQQKTNCGKTLYTAKLICFSLCFVITFHINSISVFSSVIHYFVVLEKLFMKIICRL